MAIEYAQLRSVILDYLKENPGGVVNFAVGYSGILEYCKRRGIELSRREDAPTVMRIFHELYLERIIITGQGPEKGQASEEMGWPVYRLTDYGYQAIKQNDYAPYDPDQYLARLRERIPAVDDVIVRYAAEALACLRANCLLAASVMLGCAAEKAILQLVDAFGNAIKRAADKAAYDKETRSWVISTKYEALWKRLEPLSPSLPKELRDDLHAKLDQAFDLIRTTRNAAGHPTGKTVDRETVLANLILFPVYCKRVYDLVAHFAATPVL